MLCLKSLIIILLSQDKCIISANIKCLIIFSPLGMWHSFWLFHEAFSQHINFWFVSYKVRVFGSKFLSHKRRKSYQTVRTVKDREEISIRCLISKYVTYKKPTVSCILLRAILLPIIVSLRS